MDFLMVLLLAVGLVSLAFLGLAVRLILRKRGKFPNIHVSGNKPLKRKGISCAHTQDRLEQQKARGKVNYTKIRLVSPKRGGN